MWSLDMHVGPQQITGWHEGLIASDFYSTSGAAVSAPRAACSRAFTLLLGSCRSVAARRCRCRHLQGCTS